MSTPTPSEGASPAPAGSGRPRLRGAVLPEGRAVTIVCERAAPVRFRRPPGRRLLLAIGLALVLPILAGAAGFAVLTRLHQPPAVPRVPAPHGALGPACPGGDPVDAAGIERIVGELGSYGPGAELVQQLADFRICVRLVDLDVGLGDVRWTSGATTGQRTLTILLERRVVRTWSTDEPAAALAYAADRAVRRALVETCGPLAPPAADPAGCPSDDELLGLLQAAAWWGARHGPDGKPIEGAGDPTAHWFNVLLVASRQGGNVMAHFLNDYLAHRNHDRHDGTPAGQLILPDRPRRHLRAVRRGPR